jgi:hypothetical protein
LFTHFGENAHLISGVDQPRCSRFYCRRRARRAGTAAARQTPPGEIRHVVVVDRMSDATCCSRRGAVGLLRPSYGPTTNRRRALAELVRGI